MSHESIIIKINDKDFEAVVEFTPAWSKAATINLAPEDCCESEGEVILIHSLHMFVNVCGIETKQDVFFLIDSLADDIREQLND